MLILVFLRIYFDSTIYYILTQEDYKKCYVDA